MSEPYVVIATGPEGFAAWLETAEGRAWVDARFAADDADRAEWERIHDVVCGHE